MVLSKQRVALPKKHTMQTFIQVGEHFWREASLLPDEITRFAEMVGDSNPVHHDADAAKAVGFDGIIASGPHTSAILTSILADHYSRRAPMLGLEFTAKFLQPILADKCCRYEWEVTSVQTKPRLFGELVSLTGRVIQEGKTAISATASVAVMFDKTVPLELQRGNR